MLKRPAIVLLLLSMSKPLAAQQPDPGSCADTAATQMAMTHCAAQEWRQSITRLDSLLVELRASVDSARQVGLDSAQVLWGAYVTAACRWEAAAFSGGSVYPMQLASCRASLTRERIQELAPSLCEAQSPDCPRGKHYRQSTGAGE